MFSPFFSIFRNYYCDFCSRESVYIGCVSFGSCKADTRCNSFSCLCVNVLNVDKSLVREFSFWISVLCLLRQIREELRKCSYLFGTCNAETTFFTVFSWAYIVNSVLALSKDNFVNNPDDCPSVARKYLQLFMDALLKILCY